MTKRWVETELTVERWAKDNGFVYATAVGNGRPGRDILNTPSLSIEVKARGDWSPLAWVRQAVAASNGDLPFVVARMKGQGPAQLDDWPVIIRMGDFTKVLREAGYLPGGE